MNSPIKINDIDRIFYINLDRRPDRDANIKEQLKKTNLLQIAERVSAIDGPKLDLQMVKSIITPKGVINAQNMNGGFGVPLTRGAIGCAMSHRAIWIQIRDDPMLNSALILEDDIEMNDDFVSKFNTYKKYVPLNYDIIYLGYHLASIDSSLENVNAIFVKLKKVYGTFGYIVTKQGAEKLLKMFPISEQVDTEMFKCFHKFGINTYLLKPDLRLITSEPSDITTKFGTDVQVR